MSVVREKKSPSFAGFSPLAFEFFRDLKKNNNRDWFTPRKPQFEDLVRKPMLELVTAVHREMMRFAPEYVGDPAKCLYRIYRDTRFSPDKSPYKTHQGALLWHNRLEKESGASYFFSISPEGCGVAGGLYSPEPDMLLAVRQQIANDLDAFKATFETRKIKKLMGDLHGEKLARVPKGFDASDPAADYLKHKRYILYIELEPGVATTPKVLAEIVSRFEAIAPFVEYLNRPLLKRHAKRKREKQFLE